MSKNNRYLTRDEIIKIGKTAEGKKLGYYFPSFYNDENKGVFGLMMEENLFNYSANSDANPDFIEAGLELKVTPVKQNKNGTLSAKERLVLNIINYMEEYKNTFITSSFWNKNKSLYLIFYLWEKDLQKSDYRILKSMLYEYPEKDLFIIMNDWNIIVNKIKAGLAHEISEADTMYLGACCKGKDKNSLRAQPFSDVLAMQRAFCLKNSYMTQLVRKHISYNFVEDIIKQNDELSESFECVIFNRVKKYIGKTQLELAATFKLSITKDLNERLFSAMLGVKRKAKNTDEFLKANIVPKTIRINSNGYIKESMSFPAFKFTEIIKEDWIDSTLRRTFEETKFLFVIFKEINNEYYFNGIKLWNMPVNVIDNQLKTVWDNTVDIINSGNIVKSINNGKRKTNFPGMSENNVCHVRPHGKNSLDTYQLPVPDILTGCRYYTKQCFWLNNKYISNILKDL